MPYIGAGLTRFNTADELTVTGDATLNGNANLGDNGKAQFGASQDLQIFHNASASYITDQGTGNLVLGGDAAILLQNSAHSANMLDAYNGGRVGLYHAGTLKAETTSSGIDVTGTATADGLDLGTTTDAATVSNTASDYQLQLGAAQSTTGDIGRNISFALSGTTTAAINTVDAGTGNAQSLAFFTGNGTSIAERLRIDSSGNVGIGTVSPDAPLEIESSGSDFATLKLNAPGNSTAAGYLLRAHDGDFDIRDANNSATRMTIDSSGIVKHRSANNIGRIMCASTTSIADDSSVTLTNATAGGVIAMIYDTSTGSGASVFFSYTGTPEIIKQSDSSYVIGDTDTKFCIIKNANSHSCSFKNRSGAIRSFQIFLIGGDVRG